METRRIRTAEIWAQILMEAPFRQKHKYSYNNHLATEVKSEERSLYSWSQFFGKKFQIYTKMLAGPQIFKH